MQPHTPAMMTQASRAECLWTYRGQGRARNQQQQQQVILPVLLLLLLLCLLCLVSTFSVSSGCGLMRGGWSRQQGTASSSLISVYKLMWLLSVAKANRTSLYDLWLSRLGPGLCLQWHWYFFKVAMLL